MIGLLLRPRANRKPGPNIQQSKRFPYDSQTIPCVTPPVISIKRISRGGANNRLRIVPDDRFPQRPNAARVLWRRYDDDRMLSVAPHPACDFFNFLLCIDNHIWEDFDLPLGYPFVDQNLTVVCFFADVLNAKFREFLLRTVWI